MASLAHRIEVAEKHRPCYVQSGKGKKKAVFHRWYEERQAVAPSALQGGYPGGIIATLFGVVETEDGKIHTVIPAVIQFVDHEEFETYSWSEE